MSSEPSDALVFFGATGDLAYKQIFPSLLGLIRDEGLDVLTITMRTNIAVNALLSRNIDYATPSTSVIKAAKIHAE